MQTAAPELMDLSRESATTLNLYGNALTAVPTEVEALAAYRGF